MPVAFLICNFTLKAPSPAAPAVSTQPHPDTYMKEMKKAETQSFHQWILEESSDSQLTSIGAPGVNITPVQDLASLLVSASVMQGDQ